MVESKNSTKKCNGLDAPAPEKTGVILRLKFDEISGELLKVKMLSTDGTKIYTRKDLLQLLREGWEITIIQRRTKKGRIRTESRVIIANLEDLCYKVLHPGPLWKRPLQNEQQQSVKCKPSGEGYGDELHWYHRITWYGGLNSGSFMYQLGLDCDAQCEKCSAYDSRDAYLGCVQRRNQSSQ